MSDKYINKVVITDSGFPNVDQEKAIIESSDTALFSYQCKTETEVAQYCKDADAILTQWAPITAKVINQMVNCKVIVRYGIGVDNVDLEAARKKNIAVVNVPDYAIDEVADHTFSLLLSSVRKIPQIIQNVRQGEWNIAPCRPIMGIQGKLLGLAGFGNIAKAVAKRAQAFGMNIAAYDPFISKELMHEYGAIKMDWNELLENSDVISIHLPLNDYTKNLVNEQAFHLMKPSAYLINTSRGGIINTDALLHALMNKDIAGAAIDVIEQEPIAKDHPLLTLENCLVTSHCAWYSESSLLRLQAFAAKEVKRVLEGQSPKHIVNGVKL